MTARDLAALPLGDRAGDRLLVEDVHRLGRVSRGYPAAPCPIDQAIVGPRLQDALTDLEDTLTDQIAALDNAVQDDLGTRKSWAQPSESNGRCIRGRRAGVFQQPRRPASSRLRALATPADSRTSEPTQ